MQDVHQQFGPVVAFDRRTTLLAGPETIAKVTIGAVALNSTFAVKGAPDSDRSMSVLAAYERVPSYLQDRIIDPVSHAVGQLLLQASPPSSMSQQ